LSPFTPTKEKDRRKMVFFFDKVLIAILRTR
jgi:hypothetical protein